MPRRVLQCIVLAALVACGGDSVDVGVLTPVDDSVWTNAFPDGAFWADYSTLWLSQDRELSQLEQIAGVNWIAGGPPMPEHLTAWFDRSDATRAEPFHLDPPDPRYERPMGADIRWCDLSRDGEVLDCSPHARFELAATTRARPIPPDAPTGVGCHVSGPDRPEPGSEVRSSVFVSVAGGAAVEVRRAAEVPVNDCVPEPGYEYACITDVRTEVLPLRWESAGEDWILRSDEETWSCVSWWSGWECTGESSFLLVHSDDALFLCGTPL